MIIQNINIQKFTVFQAKKEKFNCNYIMGNGMPIFEATIKSEEAKFLPYFYLPSEDIIFTEGMLKAYNNIKNPEFKEKLEKSDKIFMRFPELEKAIKENNINGIENGIKTLAQCKFCNRFHTLYLLACNILRDYDSILDKYSRSIEFVKASEKYMPEIFARIFTRFSETQKYILNIKKFIQNPQLIDTIIKDLKL